MYPVDWEQIKSGNPSDLPRMSVCQKCAKKKKIKTWKGRKDGSRGEERRVKGVQEDSLRLWGFLDWEKCNINPSIQKEKPEKNQGLKFSPHENFPWGTGETQRSCDVELAKVVGTMS